MMKVFQVSCVLAVVAALGLMACGSDDGSGGSAGSAGSAGGGTPVGNGQCTSEAISTTDGTSACEPPAAAGEHCSQSGVTTLNGCLTEANCAQGQACDKSANTKDIEGNATGVCRAPKTFACGGGAGSGNGGSGGGSSGVDCLSGGSDATAECKTFAACVKQSCDAQLKQAFGAGYASGQAGGDCQAYYACIQKQNCEDPNDSCSALATGACQSAVIALASCQESSCGSQGKACDDSEESEGAGGAGGGPATQYCKDLVSCCQQIEDEFDRDTCASAASSNSEFVCQSELTQRVASNDCKAP